MSQSGLDYHYKIALRLKMRQTSGDAFQDFFSAVMEKRSSHVQHLHMGFE